MTINSIRTSHIQFKIHQNISGEKPFPLIEKYGINIEKLPIFGNGVIINLQEKIQITERLLEAHELAVANIKAGNITKRGFATNICTNDNHWSIGTNFNNTRNDISSVCGERSAILASYNDALIRFSKSGSNYFNFKIKYICMAQSEDLSMIKNSAVPCEDCLSWLNTTRYFDDNTTIFSFEKNEKGILCLKSAKLTDFLPCKDYKLSSDYSLEKPFKYSSSAINSMEKYAIPEEDILLLLDKNFKLYKENPFSNISNQNITCSIIANKNIYSASKIDWTKRWFVEPLEYAASKAIEQEKENCKITAIAYFGDNSSVNPLTKEEYSDGGISIKSLGRIRQKYANPDTLLILNLENCVNVITIGEYLPKKFIQGYKII